MITGLGICIRKGWEDNSLGDNLFGTGFLGLIILGIFGWGVIANLPTYDHQETVYWPLKRLESGDLYAFTDDREVLITDRNLQGQLRGAESAPVTKAWSTDLYGNARHVRYTLDERNILLNYPLKNASK